LKGGDTDASRQAGSVLKVFPDKQMHAAGYINNVAIGIVFKKKCLPGEELQIDACPCRAQRFGPY
jgi:hypothetical protein